MPSPVLKQIGEFLINLLYLTVHLLCQLVIFICVTSTSIGISTGISRSYMYFNHVKLSSCLEIFISLVFLVPFSCIQVNCAALIMRRRRILHPCILQIVPAYIYAFLYIFSFTEMIYRYIQVHALPLGITNDGMYMMEDSSQRPFSHRPHGVFSPFKKKHNSHKILHQDHLFNETEHSSLVAKKNWETTYFLFAFFYVVYVSGNVVVKNLQTNTDDQPGGSVKSFFAYITLTIIEICMVIFSLFFVEMGRIALFSSSSLCSDTYNCTKYLMLVALLVGLAGGFLESAAPFPRKRNQNDPPDPFDWYKNILRARLTVMYLLFMCINWSFFEDRQGYEVSMAERSLIVFNAILAAATTHIGKIFTIIFIIRAKEIRDMFRNIMVGFRDGNGVIVPANVENPPELPDMSTDDDDATMPRENSLDNDNQNCPLRNASTQTLNSKQNQPSDSDEEKERNNNLLVTDHEKDHSSKIGGNSDTVVNIIAIPEENSQNTTEQSSERLLCASVEFGPEVNVVMPPHSSVIFNPITIPEIIIIDENNNSTEESAQIHLDVIDDLLTRVNEAVNIGNTNANNIK